MGAGVGNVVSPVATDPNASQQQQPGITDLNAAANTGVGGKGGAGAQPTPWMGDAPNMTGAPIPQPGPVMYSGAQPAGKGGAGAQPMSDLQKAAQQPGVGGKGGNILGGASNPTQPMPPMANVIGNFPPSTQPIQKPGVGGKGGMGSAPSVNHLANLLGGKGGVHQQPNPIPAPTMDHRQTLGPMQGGNNTPNLLNNLHPKTNVGGLNSLHPTTVNPAVDPSFQSLYPGVNPNAGTPVNPNTFG